MSLQLSLAIMNYLFPELAMSTIPLCLCTYCVFFYCAFLLCCPQFVHLIDSYLYFKPDLGNPSLTESINYSFVLTVYHFHTSITTATTVASDCLFIFCLRHYTVNSLSTGGMLIYFLVSTTVPAHSRCLKYLLN